MDSTACRVRQGAAKTAKGGLKFGGPAAGASVAALAASRGAGPVCSVNLLCRVGGVPRSDVAHVLVQLLARALLGGDVGVHDAGGDGLAQSLSLPWGGGSGARGRDFSYVAALPLVLESNTRML